MRSGPRQYSSGARRHRGAPAHPARVTSAGRSSPCRASIPAPTRPCPGSAGRCRAGLFSGRSVMRHGAARHREAFSPDAPGGRRRTRADAQDSRPGWPRGVPLAAASKAFCARPAAWKKHTVIIWPDPIRCLRTFRIVKFCSRWHENRSTNFNRFVDRGFEMRGEARILARYDTSSYGWMRHILIGAFRVRHSCRWLRPE